MQFISGYALAFSVLFPTGFCSGPLLPYRDASRGVDERVEDLLHRMTVAEKAGQLFILQLDMGPNGELDEGDVAAHRNRTDTLIGEFFVSHFHISGTVEDATERAEWYNRVQKRALETRLGIPVTLATDPLHRYSETTDSGLSQWPGTLGLAALRDARLVRQFADVARQEYTAIGLRTALHPQIDLVTEARWARSSNTFGEDADLTAELLVAYIKGFQGNEIGPQSVSTVTKHFPGSGPLEDGEDSHFAYGKNQTYPGDNFEYHLKPFRAAIKAGARQIIPAYGRPVGTKYEEVGFGFNKEIVTGLLKEELGFDGIVVADWNLITDFFVEGEGWHPARAWGLEDATELERTIRILDAGADIIGGESRVDLIQQLVREGIVSEERLDASVRKLLREKFLLGLFDNPFVDAEEAGRIVGNEDFVRQGNDAQRRSYTLLTNKNQILPLRDLAAETKFYVEGVNAALIEDRGFAVVEQPEEADYALLRLVAPYEPRSGVLEAGLHAGSLEYSVEERARQAAIYAAAPSIVDINLDRPVAIPEIAEQAAALLASYSSSTEAFLDVVFGVAEPEGELPWDLPRSDAAVENSMEDVPYDTRDPVFKFGHGLRYA
ncbi:hypothetical protein DL766_002291 [Monosporascus sp. MC13-8B]|uniref:beta-glucosidase n=1 Tax=Monosporascus cannonballus TaxID=155416 RepID=A0ABY0HEZ9_9PEZI|nr:hypothetical protein DL763_010751 [Monosporascus cannonballus]RYO91938.1 hypothetical protein DL762_001876 [Monosporascus cannonballus]RYP35824.1 hypothetical protein DL766_002291 [Monosporascus sp. MC13-8B]